MGDWLTVDEVAAQLKVHQETIRRWLRSGKLDGIWLSDRAGWRISQEAWTRFLEEKAGKAVA